MIYTIEPKGVCARKIILEVSPDRKIIDIQFIGGCKGNAEAIRCLLKGKSLSVLEDLASIKCGYKDTSCVAEAARYSLTNI